MPRDPIHILFVCLGNICRSPLAEGVFRGLVRDERVADRFEIDSAGTSGYHVGDPPDPRTTAVARTRGIELEGRSRQIQAEDLERFDYIVVMDADNLEAVRCLADAANPGAEIHLLRRFDPEAGGELDVPDPYFGGSKGFEHVHDLVERSCRGLLEHIRSEHAL